jgi:hypothetical protein
MKTPIKMVYSPFGARAGPMQRYQNHSNAQGSSASGYHNPRQNILPPALASKKQLFANMAPKDNF